MNTGITDYAEAVPLLEVENLSVCVEVGGRQELALSQVSLSINKGEIVGVVGESGCGKTMMALSIIGLLAENSKIVKGSIRLQGEEISSLSQRALRRFRGRRVGMIFQEPMVALDPLMRVGHQVEEVLAIHHLGSRSERRRRVTELFNQVGLSGAALRIRQYPHELSGGMRQRVMIAMALAAEPALLIADEPTTAVDTTVQAQILDLLLDIRDRLGTSVLFVTHDMGVIAEVADRVVVMYAGQVVEIAPVQELFSRPKHPYTSGLLQSIMGMAAVSEGQDLPTIIGRVPSLGDITSGCPFAPRCLSVQDRCVENRPTLRELEPGHMVACWVPLADQTDADPIVDGQTEGDPR